MERYLFPIYNKLLQRARGGDTDDIEISGFNISYLPAEKVKCVGNGGDVNQSDFFIHKRISEINLI